MEERKQQMLQYVIEQYIETAQPVGSSMIADSQLFDVSGATIRNELHALEQEGYLTHPHTSAGRIPTEQGYRYYVSDLMKPETPKKQVREYVEMIQQEMEAPTDAIKQIAKLIAQYSSVAVIVEVSRGSIYYTGLSHLFAQPEFRDYAQTLQVSELFDQCEVRVPYLHDLVTDDDIHTFIGEGNPLGRGCSTLAMRTKEDMLFLLFGHLRMHYKRNCGIMKYLQTVL